MTPNHKSPEKHVEAAPQETDPLLLKGLSTKILDTHYQGSYSRGIVEWFNMLSENFGLRFLLLLVIYQHMLRGTVSVSVMKLMPWMYKSYHVPASQKQLFHCATNLPWALKPVIGLMSDIFPVRGYHKGPYMLVASIGGGAALAILGLVPHRLLSVHGVVVCFVFKSLQISTCDLLIDAKIAEKVKAAPEFAPALTTYMNFGMTIGGLLSSLGTGPILHRYGPKTCFTIASIPALAVVAPICFGYLDEGKRSREEIRQTRQRIGEQKQIVVLCAIMLCSAVCLSVMGLVSHDPVKNCIIAFSIALFTLISFSIVLSPVIAKFNAFTFLLTILSLSHSSAAFYFFTDDKKEYPEGPHLSDFFVVTVMSTLGSCCSLVGIFLYQRFFRSWNYRKLLVVTNIAVAILAVCDILLFARVNVRLGISDRALLIILSICMDTVGQFQSMPRGIMFAHLCPKGMESIMTALLASSHNLGHTISMCGSSVVMKILDIEPDGGAHESIQFERLWILCAISSGLSIGLTYALIWLVPDVRQTDSILDSEEFDATKGSVLNRLIKRSSRSAD